MSSPLEQNVQYLKGVGPRRAKLLKKLGIQTISDLLTYFPRDWEDRSNLIPIASAQPGRKALVQGKIILCDELKTRSRIRIFKAAVQDKSGVIYALWFKKGNPRYDIFSGLKKQIERGKEIFLYGNVENRLGQREMNVEVYELKPSNKGQGLLHLFRIVPLYFLTKGLEEKFFRSLVKNALMNYLSYLRDCLPYNLRKHYHLLPYRNALEAIHFPKNFSEKEKAYRRLAFEEFFLMQLALKLRYNQVKRNPKGRSYLIKRFLLSPFRKNLGFDFTGAQKRVINEIFSDLQSPEPMNRLLQGDVGSGKTVVALSAMLLAMENGYQSTFLAPTEILAEQHYLTFKHFLRDLPVNFALLTGKTKKRERKRIFEDLEKGEIPIIIGTHALLEEKVIFKNLALVVIDEQHRFGVIQRAKIREKGNNPDVLVITATPIPRSLALTLFGDLDISVLDEMPPGRQTIHTLSLPEEATYEFVKKEVFSGHQAYIVYPLIEESDKLELKAATTEAERLKKEIFPSYRVGLIHGQLPAEEKEKIMLDFRQGKYNILIATTVIEVGIDVPNATVMVIEHADRFGLATLHQLRGRVGRGKDKSCCLLLGKPRKDFHPRGKPQTELAKKRMETILGTTDGFRIAEEDLKLRGPGEFFGTIQHGLPDFRIGDPIKDYNLLKEAREAVTFLISKQADLRKEEKQLLRERIRFRFDSRITLSGII